MSEGETPHVVVVEDDQDAIPRLTDVDLVAVPAEFERRPVGFERVLVGDLTGPAMAEDRDPGPPQRHEFVPGLRLVWRLGLDGRERKDTEHARDPWGEVHWGILRVVTRWVDRGRALPVVLRSPRLPRDSLAG